MVVLERGGCTNFFFAAQYFSPFVRCNHKGITAVYSPSPSLRSVSVRWIKERKGKQIRTLRFLRLRGLERSYDRLLHC